MEMEDYVQKLFSDSVIHDNGSSGAINRRRLQMSYKLFNQKVCQMAFLSAHNITKYQFECASKNYRQLNNYMIEEQNKNDVDHSDNGNNSTREGFVKNKKIRRLDDDDGDDDESNNLEYKCLDCKCCRILKTKLKNEESKSWRLPQEIIPQSKFKGNERIEEKNSLGFHDVENIFKINMEEKDIGMVTTYRKKNNI